jgi:hypothetical protein
MRFWQFSKPKGPGFGISKNFYISVLAAKATLPPVLEIVNPQGSGGALEGFGAPLMSSSTKDDLTKPMQRGAYAIASKDRKTVLKCIVIPKEEAGFDPEAFLRSPHAALIPDEMAARIRSTWTLLQLTFESHDPDVYPSLEFLQRLVIRLGDLTDGVIADPTCRRYQLPNQVRVGDRVDPRIDVREHVSVQLTPGKEGLHAYSLGLQKFNLPEFELYGIPDSLHGKAQLFLLNLGQLVLKGESIKAGDTVGDRSAGFEVREGGLDRGIWEGIPVYELIPVRDKTVEQALTASG